MHSGDASVSSAGSMGLRPSMDGHRSSSTLGTNMSASRRARKNKREKERRMEVADKFEEITHVVGLPDRAKANKVNVLSEAIRTIQVRGAAGAIAAGCRPHSRPRTRC